MTPSSDQLEAFFERLNALDRELSKLKGTEVRKAETIAEIKALSKDWLRVSEALRAVEALPHENLHPVDSCLKELLQSTNARARASAYRKKLAPVVSIFTDRIVVPVIRFEGSPSKCPRRRWQVYLNFSDVGTSTYSLSAWNCGNTTCKSLKNLTVY